MGSQQHFCLKWNNHQNNLLLGFDDLLQNQELVDVTLACDGDSLKAHKVVLSACSPYFQVLFKENPCKHPIIILKDTKLADVRALVDFMYKGQVNVSQRQMPTLLKTAETLKVKGLTEILTNLDDERSASPVTANIVEQSMTGGSLVRKRRHKVVKKKNIKKECSVAGVPTAESDDEEGKENLEEQDSAEAVAAAGGSTSRVGDGKGLEEGVPIDIDDEFISPDVIHVEHAYYSNDGELRLGGGSGGGESNDGFDDDDQLNSEIEDVTVSCLPARSTNGNQVKAVRHRNRRTYYNWNPEDMVAAMTLVKEGKMSAFNASRKFNIPRTSLWSYLKTNKLVKRPQVVINQVLTNPQEEQLASTLANLGEEGVQLTQETAAIYINNFCTENQIVLPFDDPNFVSMGKKWYCKFLLKHPEIIARHPELATVFKEPS